MEAMEFITNYNDFVEEIEQVAKPEFQNFVKEMKNTDPHDLITSETWFVDRTSARGYVWSIFLQKINNL